MKVKVYIEWPTGNETETIELEDNATEAEISGAAQDAFFNRCNYGFEKVEDGA